ncbi:MAG: restriction endonuclease subunit S, partial [Clostridia bacterium]|nr:restriction endonuclease subunit S [Clostridia bacterium]
MRSDWREVRAADAIEFNPTLRLPKGVPATKIAMERLLPYTKRVNGTTIEDYSGGVKFCNGDTIMARITPCLENGKTAYVDVLKEGEVGFGSTEFVVLRARPGLTDEQFVYYLSISPSFRRIAIKSMVGSSGRQRVQQSVLDNMVLDLPPIEEQIEIGKRLATLDAKIAINNSINDNLEQQLQSLFGQWFSVHMAFATEATLGEVCSKVTDGSHFSPKDD